MSLLLQKLTEKEIVSLKKFTQLQKFTNLKRDEI